MYIVSECFACTSPEITMVLYVVTYCYHSLIWVPGRAWREKCLLACLGIRLAPFN